MDVTIASITSAPELDPVRELVYLMSQTPAEGRAVLLEDGSAVIDVEGSIFVVPLKDLIPFMFSGFAPKDFAPYLS